MLKYSALSQIHGTRELIQTATSYCFSSTLKQFQLCQLFSFLLLKPSWEQPSKSLVDTGDGGTGLLTALSKAPMPLESTMASSSTHLPRCPAQAGAPWPSGNRSCPLSPCWESSTLTWQILSGWLLRQELVPWKALVLPDPKKPAAGTVSLGEGKKPHLKDCSAQSHSHSTPIFSHQRDKLCLGIRATCTAPGGELPALV